MKNLILIASILLSSCANMPDFLMPNGYTVGTYKRMSVEQISSKIKTEYDSWDKITRYTAPKFDTWSAKYFMRGWKTDGQKLVKHQLVIPFSYGGRQWRFYKYADDSKRKLNMTIISREVEHCAGGSSCVYLETLGIDLTTKYLQSHKDTGLEIKVTAKGGYDKIIKVPAKYVQAYLSKVN